MKTRRVVLSLFIAVTISSCGYDKFDDGKTLKREKVYPNMDLSYVRERYAGQPMTVPDKVVLGGYVTANDRSGNFFRTFIIQDHTDAIEVKAGLYYMHNYLPEGRYVAIDAAGLVIGQYNGIMQIGLSALGSGSYETDYFGHKLIMDRYVFPATDFRDVTPMIITAGELTENFCGRLVTVNNLFPANDTIVSWAVPRSGPGELPETGYRKFKDPAGDSITVVTSGYAEFSASIIPRGRMALTGILMFGNTDTDRSIFTLKLRSIEDVQSY